MHKKKMLLVILILVIAAQLSFADSVIFKSSSTSKDGKSIALSGILTKPDGNGPFPAVVFLHGCSGLVDGKTRSEAWSNRLIDWGYVTLQVDSFEPRGMSTICDDRRLMGKMAYTRGQDAYDAKSFLAELPFVHRNRIAVMGWSHGGFAMFKVINNTDDDTDKFEAAIGIYPWCENLAFQNAPLLVLIGESDDWTPAIRCSRYLKSTEPKHETVLKIYSGAYHDFDWEGVNKEYLGHRLLYDPKATADAIIQVKNFLAKYLK